MTLDQMQQLLDAVRLDSQWRLRWREAGAALIVHPDGRVLEVRLAADEESVLFVVGGREVSLRHALGYVTDEPGERGMPEESIAQVLPFRGRS